MLGGTNLCFWEAMADHVASGLVRPRRRRSSLLPFGSGLNECIMYTNALRDDYGTVASCADRVVVLQKKKAFQILAAVFLSSLVLRTDGSRWSTKCRSRTA